VLDEFFAQLEKKAPDEGELAEAGITSTPQQEKK
jgi:hypothetical protein